MRKVDLAVELQILSFHEARKRPVCATDDLAVKDGLAVRDDVGAPVSGADGQGEPVDSRIAVMTRTPAEPTSRRTRAGSPFVGTTGGDGA